MSFRLIPITSLKYNVFVQSCLFFSVPSSPYQQKLPHSDYGYHVHSKRRPVSASSSGSKPKIDAKFIADHNIWDPATPRSSIDRRHGRPISAPVRKRYLDYIYLKDKNVHYIRNTMLNIFFKKETCSLDYVYQFIIVKICTCIAQCVLYIKCLKMLCLFLL